jgi:hypothetical protein
MLTPRPIRSLTLAGLAVLGLGVSAVPAYATALTITSLSCEAEPVAVQCDGWVGGGTPAYTYTWNPATSHRNDYSDHSEETIYCVVGSHFNVTFSVRDRVGATASKTIGVYCSGDHQ